MDVWEEHIWVCETDCTETCFLLMLVFSCIPPRTFSRFRGENPNIPPEVWTAASRKSCFALNHNVYLV